MANYYTQVCFHIRCTPAEQTLISSAINCIEADLRTDDRLKPTLDFLSQHFSSEDVDDFSICAEAEIEDDGVSISGDECPDVEAIAGVIQHLAPSALPFGFTYAESCSRPRLDAFSGGYVCVTPTAYEIVSANEVLRAAMAGAKGAKEPRTAV